jgi:hypothetical protein
MVPLPTQIKGVASFISYILSRELNAQIKGVASFISYILSRELNAQIKGVASFISYYHDKYTNGSGIFVNYQQDVWYVRAFYWPYMLYRAFN